MSSIPTCLIYLSAKSIYRSIYDIFMLSEKKQSLKSKSKKGRKDKDPDKPDTFTEKLAAHLVKNLQVGVTYITR